MRIPDDLSIDAYRFLLALAYAGVEGRDKK
jgi:hypothetical protein